MASQYIKIFNDTVLKQSILQGYEYQRQNPNLGKFTSGELAFTRDTGRVFVGNYSDEPKENDLKIVNGGILVGNKYLGIIDSRPIGYVQDKTTGITGQAGLSYEEDNEKEKALFTTNNRVKKDGKTNDWNNDPSFNSTYGTYNGDYLYDVWKNALIIFDNNIKPNSNEVIVTDAFTTEENVFDKANNSIIENGRIRTPLDDLTNNENMKDYPIYGNGYVIFRIIEPDGKTIKFKPRDITSIDSTTGKSIGNWTHNILEVNFSSDNLYPSFNNEIFSINEKGHITFNNLILEPNSTVKIPSTIKFTSSSNETVVYDFITGLSSSLQPSELNSGNNYLLGYTYETISDTSGIKLKKIDASALNAMIEKQEISITINTSGKLKVNEGFSSSGTVFNLSINDEIIEESSSGFYDPWDCLAEGFYFGTGKLESGKIIDVNDYSIIFADTVNALDTGDNEINKYEEHSAKDKEDIFTHTLSQFIANDKFVSQHEFVEVTNKTITKNDRGEPILDENGNESITETTEKKNKIYWNCNVGINYLKNPYELFKLTQSNREKTIQYESIYEVTNTITENNKNYEVRLIPDHAESIIVLITTSSQAVENLLEEAAEVIVTDCSEPIFKSNQPRFTTTVEIPLIPYVAESLLDEDYETQEISEENISNKYIISKDKKFSFTVKNCSAKLLGYRV